MQSWTRRAVVWGGVGWLLAACTHGMAEGAPYSIGVRGTGNQVIFAASDNPSGYSVLVTSESGIGEATVAWWGNESPHPLTFHLALAGLEHFQLAWASQRVSVSIGTADQRVAQSVVHQGRAEESTSTSSPYWFAVKLPTAQQSGFQLAAPPAFVADAPRLWSFSWIDYYR